MLDRASTDSRRPTTLDPELQAKLLVFKSFLLGRALLKQGRGSAARTLTLRTIERIMMAHTARPTHAHWARRLLFFHLVMAELDRANEPLRWRREAKALGEALAACGGEDPFIWYMALVKETSHRVNSGNFGDITRSGVSRVNDRVQVEIDERWGVTVEVGGRACAALELDVEEMEPWARFFGMGLGTMIERFGLG